MFFSVKKPIKIDRKAYIPCVCYPLPEALKYTVEHLKKEGKAEIYEDMVYFQSGKLIEKQTEDKKPATEKKSRKEKKEKTVEVENVEELAEEAGIAVPEESDESEGF